jgi:hypothetical protein
MSTPIPLFISRNDIITNSPLQGAIDADALLPYVRTAQNKYIKDLLGTVLYDYVSAKILADEEFDGRYIEMMELVKDCLIWYTCIEYIPFSSITFKSQGSVKHLSDQSVAPTKTDIDFLTSKCSENADYFATRLQNYLIAYSNQIPQYLQSVGNMTQIYPNMSNAYFPGLQL